MYQPAVVPDVAPDQLTFHNISMTGLPAKVHHSVNLKIGDKPADKLQPPGVGRDAGTGYLQIPFSNCFHWISLLIFICKIF
jgi:hypothetical protein